MNAKALFYDRGNGKASLLVITKDGVKGYEIIAEGSYTKKEIEIERAEKGTVGIDGHMEWTPTQEELFLVRNGYMPIEHFVGLKKVSK